MLLPFLKAALLADFPFSLLRFVLKHHTIGHHCPLQSSTEHPAPVSVIARSLGAFLDFLVPVHVIVGGRCKEGTSSGRKRLPRA